MGFIRKILLSTLAISFSLFTNAQQQELYLKIYAIDIASDHQDYLNANTIGQGNYDVTAQSKRINSSIDLVLGYCNIKNNNTQHTFGIRFLRGIYTSNSEAQGFNFKQIKSSTSAINQVGFELGIGKRYAMNKLLLIPNINLVFNHTLSSEGNSEEMHMDSLNNLVLHNKSTGTGGSILYIGALASQGIYYQVGKHLKLGGELLAALGLNRQYGTSISDTQDLISNTNTSSLSYKINSNVLYISTGIQLGIRYTF